MQQFLVLCLFVALAFAQGPLCNQTTVCFKENESGCNNIASLAFEFCAEGTDCIGNSCVRSPRLGGACGGTGQTCWDSRYTLSCVSSVCRYANIYGPGEACVTGDVNYVNGGCVTNSNCNAGTCSSVTDCSTNNLCAPHQYCDAGTCATRKVQGQNCTSTAQCDEDLVCTNFHTTGALFQCQSPFARTEGQSCLNRFDCGAGLGCDAFTCTSPPADIGDVCTTNFAACDDFFATCECSVSRHGRNTTTRAPANCERNDDVVNTNSLINAYESMQSCIKARACHDIWSARALGLVLGPNQCIRSCLRGAFETEFELHATSFNACGTAGGAAVIFPSLVVLLCVLFAYLMF